MELKAIVLAAGFGSRLRPITATLPKPLLPFCGESLLARAMRRLATLQPAAYAVNLHHLPGMVADACQRELGAFRIHLSFEEQLQGTGGVYLQLQPWLAGADAVAVHNGDIATDISLTRLLATHHTGPSPLATLALVEHRPGTTPVVVRDGRILGFGQDVADRHPEAERWTYSGLQIFDPALLRYLDPAPCELIPALQHAIASGREVRASLHRAVWFDLGTPAGLIDAYRAFAPEGYVSPAAHLAPDSQLIATTVCAYATIAAQSRLDDCVVLPHSFVPRGNHRNIVFCPSGAIEIGRRVNVGSKVGGKDADDLAPTTVKH